MSTLEIVTRVVAGVLLTGVNAFFVATEFSLTRLRQYDESEFRDDHRLRRAWEMTERLELYLTGCQLGISASSIVLGAVAEPAVSHLLRPALRPLRLGERGISVTAVVLAVVVIQLVHKVWGEQTPTYLGIERSKQVARLTATPHYWWTRAMYPLIRLGDGLAKATLRLFGVEMRRSWARDAGPEEEIDSYPELRRRIGEVLSRGDVSPDRRQEVLAALDIGQLPVREVMVPRQEMIVLSVSDPLEESLQRAANHGRVRYPLVGDSPEDLVGIVYVPALLGELDALRSGSRRLRDVAAEPFRIPAGMTVSRAIDEFQAGRQELALVEEEGRVVGLLTSTDALEAIAGELRDPFD